MTDTLPKDLDAERGAIASALAFPDECWPIVSRTRTSDYIDPIFRAIHGSMMRCQQRGEPIAPPLLVPDLKANPLFDDNPAYFLLELANEVSTSAHAEHYVNRILEKRIARGTIGACEAAINAACNGFVPKKDLSELVERIDDLRSQSAGKPRDKFTFAELRKEYPVLNLPIIDGLLRQGETANFVSTTKVGKSWFLQYVVLCIILGRDVFGRFATSMGKVLLIDNELHGATLAYRIAAVANAMGIDPADYENDLEVWPMRGRLPTLAELEAEIYEHIEPGSVKAIAFDAMYRFLPPGTNENDNRAMTEIYNALDRISAYTLGANLAVLHSSKGAQSDKRVVDVGSGAGSQSRAVDSHLILREHQDEGVAVFDAALRSFAPIEPLAVRWSFPLWQPADDIDASKLRGKQTATDVRQAEKDREGMYAIVKALGDGPATPSVIRAKTGLSKDRADRLLNIMAANGDVSVSPVTIRGNQTNEYQLVQTT